MHKPRGLRLTRLLLWTPLLALGTPAAVFLPAAPARADDRMPGEVAELTEDARAKAQKEVEALCGAADAEAAKKPRRALLQMGPAVWPVVENRMRPCRPRRHGRTSTS